MLAVTNKNQLISISRIVGSLVTLDSIHNFSASFLLGIMDWTFSGFTL